MAYCVNCGKELDGEKICQECGYDSSKVNDNNASTDDRGGIGYFLLGACIPVVGLILFIVWNKEKPRSGKAAGLGALIVFPLMFVFGIVAAFAIPAVGTIIDNTQRAYVYNDAYVIEQASTLYCSGGCVFGDEITIEDVRPYLDNFDESYYDIGLDSYVVAIYTSEGMRVYLEAAGTGEYEFPHGLIPSNSSSDDVVLDTD